jgi:23S rRNA-/tRNA-specific pseudouridylate synthase
MVATLLRTNLVWILNKPVRTHFDQLLPADAQTIWEPAHRIDYETSGAIVYVLRSHVAYLRKVFTTEGVAKKYYIAGASGAIPLEHLSQWPDTLVRVNGYCLSRYRRSAKVRFFLRNDEMRNKEFHSVQRASHFVFSLDHYSSSMNSLMSKDEWDSIRRVFDAPHLYLVRLLTGCRHQIRSYFAAMNAPLVGDSLYTHSASSRETKPWNCKVSRLQLHSWKIEFHDGEKTICATAPLQTLSSDCPFDHSERDEMEGTK